MDTWSGPYEIRYADDAVADVRALRRSDQRRIMQGIERHLTDQPKQISKSRIKRMRKPFWSQFRLRLEDFRVYYDVDDERNEVSVLRVCAKTNEPTPEESP